MQVKKKSQLQERSVAKDLNAKTVVASGAFWSAKGDVRSDKFLVECKTTEKGWYSLTEATWRKIEKEAVKDGLRIPLMCIDISSRRLRFAVFLQKDLLLDYPEYFNYEEKNFRMSTQVNSKSFRVFKYGLFNTPFGLFTVMNWDDFLYITKPKEGKVCMFPRK